MESLTTSLSPRDQLSVGEWRQAVDARQLAILPLVQAEHERAATAVAHSREVLEHLGVPLGVAQFELPLDIKMLAFDSGRFEPLQHTPFVARRRCSILAHDEEVTLSSRASISYAVTTVRNTARRSSS